MGGMTALLYAAREGQANAARALVEGGADVNEVSDGEGRARWSWPSATAIWNWRNICSITAPIRTWPPSPA